MIIMNKDEFIKFINVHSLNDIGRYANYYNKGEIAFDTVRHEISFLYNLGLFYSEYFETEDHIELIFRKEDKYYSSVYYYLKAIKLYEDNKETVDKDSEFVLETIRRLYVNISNEYSNQFRSINALSYYRKALAIDDCFDMAIGNFALAVEHHNPLIGLDKNKCDMVFNLLYELYYDLHIENLDSGHEFFMSKKKQYIETKRKYIKNSVFGKETYNPYSFFTEIDLNSPLYEDWCVKNTLYLNFINDIGNFEEAKFDIDVSQINDRLCLNEARLYSLNYLFKLFILQRRKMYECQDLNSYDMLLELSQIFQCLYSYFDKVSFFIYRYFNLFGNERGINIKSVWDKKDKNGNSLLEYKNQYLYNIFWLRKEYRENKDDKIKINELLSPDAHDYAEIRNMLEHKEFSFEEIPEMQYLNPRLLYEKTIKLANIVRNMILSIIHMVITERALIDPKTDKRNMDLVYFVYEGFR